jgi:phospholipase/lecithinase/hemolysin
VAGCRNYAQGGSRVTDPKGVGNSVGVGFIGGPLTQPVVTQLANYAADNGSANFTDKQLVTVLAGGNDLFGLTDQLTAEATAAGGAAFAQSLVGQLLAGVPAANQAAAQGAIGLAVQTEAAKTGSTPTSIVTAAVTAAATHAAMNGYTNTAVANAAAIGAAAGAAGTAAGNAYAGTTGAAKAVAGMTTAGTTLAGYIKDQIVGKGAKYVVVVNVPDVSRTPDAQKHPTTVPLILNMTMAFNQALQAGLANTSGVLVVDAFAENQRQVNNPAHYALSNVTEIACDLTKTIAASSLVCTKDTLVTKDASGKAVTQDDVYHYLFADGVHPTPYGYKLLAQYVTKEMIRAGWL